MITLYDAGPTPFPVKSLGFSPFVRRIIFTLNYKNLPYKIVEVAYDEIEATARSIGAPPTRQKPDGSPKYTVPIIQDATTGKIVSDSFKIAEYLDEAYPDTPKVIPPGTRVLQSVFADKILWDLFPMFPAMRPKINTFLSEEFKAGQRKILGDAVMDTKLSPEEEARAWEKARAALDSLGKAFGAQQEGPYVMGGDVGPTFADFAVVGFMYIVQQVYGEDSDKWREVSGWADGRVGTLCAEVILNAGTSQW